RRDTPGPRTPAGRPRAAARGARRGAFARCGSSPVVVLVLFDLEVLVGGVVHGDLDGKSLLVQRLLPLLGLPVLRRHVVIGHPRPASFTESFSPTVDFI